MSSFDIGTLLDFKPPKYLCKNCKGLLFSLRGDWKTRSTRCPVCGLVYKETEEYPFYKAGEYLENERLGIKFDNSINQGRKLAAIAYSFNKNSKDYPPMRALLEAVSTASQFVHFSTYGLSRSLHGVMKLKAQTIPVRGIASNVQPEFAKEIRDNLNEAPRLQLQIFEQNSSADTWNSIPHQKLVVIDGLMAFKGAANMTDSGWRKAATGHDFIEVVTDVQVVAELHNKLFSPIWAERNQLSEIKMTNDFF